MAVAAITYAIGCLYKTAILEHEKYSAMASENQFGSTTVKAARGTIYDTNGKILAQSSAVYNIILAPGIINGNASLDNSERDRQARCAAKILVEEIPDFGYTEDEIVKMFYAEDTAGRQWIKLASKVDRPVVDKIMERAKADELSGNLIYTEQESKRFYPQGSLAANVIGFTNYEGDGIYGVEASYNDYLAGIDGKVISAKDGRGNEMPYNESEVYQSKDGDSIYLTIDSTLQYYLEKELNACVEQNNVQERASAIIMDAKTGAVISSDYACLDKRAVLGERPLVDEFSLSLIISGTIKAECFNNLCIFRSVRILRSESYISAYKERILSVAAEQLVTLIPTDKLLIVEFLSRNNRDAVIQSVRIFLCCSRNITAFTIKSNRIIFCLNKNLVIQPHMISIVIYICIISSTVIRSI